MMIEMSRVIDIKLKTVGTGSKMFIVPVRWLRLNRDPDVLEVTFTFDDIVLRPPRRGGGDEQ
ncbi:MAG: hypothetical protein DRI39_07680 [Chloroflexi bacterium]|nr:MAG: hypothetical protein DRI39_07680 [Chloroflexota bacterium]